MAKRTIRRRARRNRTIRKVMRGAIVEGRKQEEEQLYKLINMQVHHLQRIKILQL